MSYFRRPAPARPEDDDHEEEFYYNEIDVPLQTIVSGSSSFHHLNHHQHPQHLQPAQHKQSVSLCKAPSVQTDKSLVIRNTTGGKAPMLSDHMDMARPPHENPEYGGRPILPATGSPAYATIISSNGTPIQWTTGGEAGQVISVPEPATGGGAVVPAPAHAGGASLTQHTGAAGAPPPAGTVSVSGPTAAMHAVPIAIPITTFTIASSQHVSISSSDPRIWSHASSTSAGS